MKANELQIGDYVNYRGQIIKVTSIYDKGNSNEIGWSDKESVWVNGRCIEPIPLTAEILEKNGFILNSDYDVWETFVDEIKIIVGIYHPDFINIEYEQHTPDGVNKGEISSICKVDGSNIYVHELQHALRLCGIEKEINIIINK